MSSAPSPSTSRGPGWIGWLFAALLFSGIASFVYEPALRGPLVSDDLLIFVGHPWMEELNTRNVVTILNPRANRCWPPRTGRRCTC